MIQTTIFSEQSLREVVVDAFSNTAYVAKITGNGAVFVYDIAKPDTNPLISITVRFIQNGNKYSAYLAFDVEDRKNPTLPARVLSAEKKISAPHRRKTYVMPPFTDPMSVMDGWENLVRRIYSDVKVIAQTMSDDVSYIRILQNYLMTLRRFVDEYKNSRDADMAQKAMDVDVQMQALTGHKDWKPSMFMNIIQADPLEYMEFDQNFKSSASMPKSVVPLEKMVANAAHEMLG